MSYDWIKAAHLAAVLMWTGGLLVQTLVLVAAHRQSSTFDRGFAEAISNWDRTVTTPALLIVWSMGLWAALSAGWLTAPWLWGKLAIVVWLSALHGVQSGSLRRVAAGMPIVHANLGWRPFALAASFTTIAFLAVLKPFT